METQNSIERLQAAAVMLAIVEEDMPDISLRLHNLQIWNGGMTIVPSTGGHNSQAKIMVDWANLHRANLVVGRVTTGGFISAYLRLEGLPEIPLLRIGMPTLVALPDYRAQIMEAITPLPPELRLKIYKMLARYLCHQHRERGEKKRTLLKQLRDLEGK